MWVRLDIKIQQLFKYQVFLDNMKPLKDITGTIIGIVIGATGTYTLTPPQQTAITDIMNAQASKQEYVQILPNGKTIDGKTPQQSLGVPLDSSIKSIDTYLSPDGQKGYIVNYKDGASIGFGAHGDEFTHASATST